MIDPRRPLRTVYLRWLGLDIDVRESVGDYPSLTFLINGVDVRRRQPGAPSKQACRLDVPTAADVLAALGGRAASST